MLSGGGGEAQGCLFVCVDVKASISIQSSCASMSACVNCILCLWIWESIFLMLSGSLLLSMAQWLKHVSLEEQWQTTTRATCRDTLPTVYIYRWPAERGRIAPMLLHVVDKIDKMRKMRNDISENAAQSHTIIPQKQTLHFLYFYIPWHVFKPRFNTKHNRKWHWWLNRLKTKPVRCMQRPN